MKHTSIQLPLTADGSLVRATDKTIVAKCFGDNETFVAVERASYVTRACNEYPKLVEDRARLVEELRRVVRELPYIPMPPASLYAINLDSIKAILSEIGEV